MLDARCDAMQCEPKVSQGQYGDMPTAIKQLPNYATRPATRVHGAPCGKSCSPLNTNEVRKRQRLQESGHEGTESEDGSSSDLDVGDGSTS